MWYVPAMSETTDERRARRRREKALLYSPGEWLWVIGFFGSWAVAVLYFWPEMWPIVVGLILTLALTTLI